MVSAVMTARIQTLTRQINRCQLQQTLLSQQEQTLSSTSAQIGREYKKAYAYVNGVYGTISAEQEDAFTSKLEQLEPVYYTINLKDSEIQTEIKELDTQLNALSKELEKAQKSEEEQAKKDAPKLTR